MIIGNRKEELVRAVLLHVLRDSLSPSENRLRAILNCKSQVRPGIWTRPLEQNAVALPLRDIRQFKFNTVIANPCCLAQPMWSFFIFFSAVFRVLRLQGASLPGHGAPRAQHPPNHLQKRPDGLVTVVYPEVRQRCSHVSPVFISYLWPYFQALENLVGLFILD